MSSIPPVAGSVVTPSSVGNPAVPPSSAPSASPAVSPASTPAAAIVDSVDISKRATTITAEDFATARAVLEPYSTGAGRSIQAGTRRPANGTWSRGLLQAKHEHLGQGSLITVYSGHAKPSDQFGLTLQLQIHGRTINLKAFGTRLTPNTNAATPHEGVMKFYLPDSEVEALLKQHVPNASPEDVLKNGRFAIAGNWVNGHRWGGFDRQGVFTWTPKAGAAGPVEPTIVVGLGGSKVELDVTVPITASVRKQYAALDTKDALFVSHLEAEGKARVPLTRLKEIYGRLQLLASNDPADAAAKQQAMAAIFGGEAGDWEVKRLSKYDPKGVAMTPDAHGYLPVNPFYDVYLDNQARSLSASYIALRARSVAGENNNFTQINYKPGPGMRDNSTNVARRIETEIICKKDVARNPRLLLPLLNDTAQPLNPHNLGAEWVKQQTGGALPASDGTPQSEITQFSSLGANRRFKFEFENKKTLVAFEASLDLCATLCLDGNGMPLRVDAQGKVDPNGQFFAMSCFGQLEPEANHMAGVVGGAQGAATPAPSTPAPAAGSASAAPGGGATPAPLGPPEIRIHGLSDLSSPIFDQDPGYVQFSKSMPALQQWLFGGPVGSRDGAHSTEQKNSMGQRFAGTIALTAAEQGLYAQELSATDQFRSKASGVLTGAVTAAEQKIAKAQADFSRLPNAGPQIDQAVAEARESVWAAFSQLNPLDYLDLASLPKP